MNLVTVFQIMALISGVELLVTLMVQWKTLKNIFYKH